jgi:hypothetical protein
VDNFCKLFVATPLILSVKDGDCASIPLLLLWNGLLKEGTGKLKLGDATGFHCPGAVVLELGLLRKLFVI